MVCACLPVCWPLVTLIKKECPALAQKQWHRLSGWILIGNDRKRKSHTSEIGKEIICNSGNSLFMDDLSYRRVKSQEPV